MKLAIAAFALIAIALPQEGAIAQAVYNAPHKWVDSFGKIRVFIPGTADTTVDVITESSKEYTFTVDYCGWINIRESATRKIKSFLTSVNSLTVNFATPFLTNTIAPACTPGSNGIWSLWQWGDTVDKPNGYLFRVQGTFSYWVKVRPALQTAGGIQGFVTYENTIKSKINSCGFATIIVSPTRPMTTFKIAGVDYNLATLPSVNKPQICRIQSGVKMRYVPLN
ncbi:hypothetical protein QUA43_29960 [Microcoleus sp. N9_B4]|uniref:hypothetical protein n=1 Tax=Microcoleus sp. N9_B4 TaxID=3055386 RepID=UPI002FD70733